MKKKQKEVLALFAATMLNSIGASADTPIIPPYYQPFDDKSSFDLFKTIDANKDGKTWEWTALWYGKAISAANDYVPADDWLLTPSFSLKAGMVYEFSFTARRGLADYPQLLEVAWGKGDNPFGYTVLRKADDLPTADTEFIYEIQPAEDGDYTFGFHDVSRPMNYKIYVDDIRLNAGILLSAPDSVTAFNVIPGGKGSLSARLEFKTPSRRINGNSLSATDSLRISRDGKYLATLKGLSAGAAAEYSDARVESGSHEYSVTPYEAGQEGRTARHKVFVGNDVPKSPSAVLEDSVSNIYIHWQKLDSVGANGGYVNLAQLRYNLFESDGTVIKRNITDDHYSIAYSTDEGAQTVKSYLISASCRNRESDKVSTAAMVVGKPFSLPFSESFSHTSSTSNSMIWSERDADDEGVWIASTSSSDGDGASYQFSSDRNGDASSLNIGKVSLKDAGSPTLLFSYRDSVGQNGLLKVIAVSPEKTDTIKTIALGQTSGWQSSGAINLGAYKNSRYIVLKFRIVNKGERLKAGIDAINIMDSYSCNLSADLNVEGKITKGATLTAYVKVSNKGLSDVSSYKVQLLESGEVVSEQNVNEKLASLAERTTQLKYEVPADRDSLLLKARVVCENDENINDDESQTRVVKVINVTLPAVKNLTLSNTGTQSVLRWNAPDKAENIVTTEDFESYSPWSIDGIGDWKTVNADGNATYGFSDITFTHLGEPYAYIVFNPSQTSPSLASESNFSPHSGKQFLASFIAFKSKYDMPQTDHWLISPELPGIQQTISFYSTELVKNYGAEKLEYLYSTTGNSPQNFVHIANDSINDTAKGTGQWGEARSFTVPDGAVYFAIRHRSQDVYAVFFDDISYVGKDGYIGNVLSYNIYRDGILIGNVGTNELSFTDPTAGTSPNYSVTAVYAIGESAPVNVNGTTGINDITVADGASSFYHVDGTKSDGKDKGLLIIRNNRGVKKVMRR